MPNMPTQSNDDDDGGGGGGDGRNALLAAIQKGAKLKKVDPEAEGKKRRATIASTATTLQTGGDLMSALKERMNLRRKGISGARKDDADGDAATGDVPEPPHKLNMASKTQSMPSLMPSHADGDDESPISMAGMANALKAAASNSHLHAGSDDDGDWSD